MSGSKVGYTQIWLDDGGPSSTVPRDLSFAREDVSTLEINNGTVGNPEGVLHCRHVHLGQGGTATDTFFGVICDTPNGNNSGPFFGFAKNHVDYAYYGLRSGVIGGTGNELTFEALGGQGMWFNTNADVTAGIYIAPNGSVRTSNDGTFQFSSTGLLDGTPDIGFGRSGARIVEVDDGTVGNANGALNCALAMVGLIFNTNIVMPADTGAIVPDNFEIASGKELEVGLRSILEVT